MTSEPKDTKNNTNSPDEGWINDLTQRLLDHKSSSLSTLQELFHKAVTLTGSLAERIHRLAPHPLDSLIIGALYLEGRDIEVRRTLRAKPDTIYEVRCDDPDIPDEDMFKRLSAVGLIQWLAGNDTDANDSIAERLLPQTGLASQYLIERPGANVPLEGGVSLSPFVASILYPGDSTGIRQIGRSLRLHIPTERLEDVVLDDRTKDEVEAFIKLCRTKDGPGRTSLFWGSAGTGKTLSAQVVAGELGLPLLEVRASDSDRDAYLIEKAGAAAKVEGAVLFLDECARWVEKQNNTNGTSPEATALLNLLQEHTGPVICAMNQGWHSITPAFKRRFTFQISYQAPEAPQRAEIWKKHLPAQTSPELISSVAEQFTISGGLIRNACLRLDKNLSGTQISSEILSTTATTQIRDNLNWGGQPIGPRIMSYARRTLSRDTRIQLQQAASRIKGHRKLPVSSHYTNQGYKILIRSSSRGMLLEVASVYLAKAAKLKMKCAVLSRLIDAENEKKSGAEWEFLMARDVAAAGTAGALPFLRIKASDFEDAETGFLRRFLDCSASCVTQYTDEVPPTGKLLFHETIQIQSAARKNTYDPSREPQFKHLNIRVIDPKVPKLLGAIKDYQAMLCQLRTAIAQASWETPQGPVTLKETHILDAMKRFNKNNTAIQGRIFGGSHGDRR